MFIWKEPTYNIIKTEEQLDAFIVLLNKAIANGDPIALDVETTGATAKAGLNPYLGWLLGISMSFGIDEGWYIPITHTKDGVLLENQLSLDTVVSKLNPVMSNGGLYLLHNAKFDYKFLWASGIKLYPNMWDTMNALKLIFGNTRQSVALKEVIKQFVTIPHTKVIASFKDAADGNQAEANLFKFATYAIDDVIYTYYLYMGAKPQIDSEHAKLFYEAETPLTPILGQMEMKGIEIDKDYFDNGVNAFNEYKKQLTLF